MEFREKTCPNVLLKSIFSSVNVSKLFAFNVFYMKNFIFSSICYRILARKIADLLASQRLNIFAEGTLHNEEPHKVEMLNIWIDASTE